MNKLRSNERRMHIAHEVGAVNEGERRKSAEEGLNHEGSYQVEEAQYLNANRSYTFKPNINLPTHYTPALRNLDPDRNLPGSCSTQVPRTAAT